MTFQDYQNLPGLNASALKVGAVSMLAMHDYITGEPKPPSPAMRMGSLIHKFVLEPESVESDVVIYEGAKRGKGWTEFQDANSSREIVTLDEFNHLTEINRAVNRNKTARDLLASTEHEVPLLWNDGAYGPAKARIDGLSSGAVVELKTTGSLSTFIKTAANMNYHLQLSWYWHGSCLHYSVKHVPVYVIACEQTRPFDVAVYRVPESILKDGYDQARTIALKYRVACQLESWPGVDEGEVLEYSLPTWAQPKQEDWTIGGK